MGLEACAIAIQNRHLYDFGSTSTLRGLLMYHSVCGVFPLCLFILTCTCSILPLSMHSEMDEDRERESFDERERERARITGKM